jgi:hypothetical protein
MKYKIGFEAESMAQINKNRATNIMQNFDRSLSQSSLRAPT